MSARSSIPRPHSVPEYVSDGARIAAILLVWGVLAACITYGTSSVGVFGTLGARFGTLGAQVGDLLELAGVLNAVLYVLYRGIDYYRVG